MEDNISTVDLFETRTQIALDLNYISNLLKPSSSSSEGDTDMIPDQDISLHGDTYTLKRKLSEGDDTCQSKDSKHVKHPVKRHKKESFDFAGYHRNSSEGSSHKKHGHNQRYSNDKEVHHQHEITKRRSMSYDKKNRSSHSKTEQKEKSKNNNHYSSDEESIGDQYSYSCASVFKSKRKSSIKEDLETEIEKIGLTIGVAPFTRGQKENLCKIIGKSNKPRQLSEFDPNVFDAELDSDNEDNKNKTQTFSVDSQKKILNEYLIPLEECKTKVDQITLTDEELPDLDEVKVTPIKDIKSLHKVRDIKVEFPSLMLSSEVEDYLDSKTVTLQPRIKVPKIDEKLVKKECTYTTNASKNKVPRLKLREPDPLDLCLQQPRYRHFSDIIDVVESDSEYEEIDYSYESFKFRNPGEYQHRKVKICNENANYSGSFGNPTSTSLMRDSNGGLYRYCVTKLPEFKWLSSLNIHEAVPDLSIQQYEVRQFRPNMVYTIESCMEEGDSFLDKVLILTKDFTTKVQEPPIDILRKILFDILLHCNSTVIVNKAYDFLQTVLDTHPPRDELPFAWCDFEMVISNICLPLGLQHSLETQRNVLALLYMATAIEREFFNRTITQYKQMFKSVAYKWLSSDSAFLNICKVLRWTFQSVGFVEYSELEASFSNLNLTDFRESQKPCHEELHIPKIFPILDKLLDLSLAISKQPTVCAEKIATEFYTEYNHLQNLAQKRFIIEHLSNPLIRMKVVNRLLSNCDSCDEGGHITDITSLEDIFHGPFKALPPKHSAFTPPPSPSEEDQNGVVTPVNPEAVEELVMLLWHCVNSYILLTKNRLWETISRRVLEKRSAKLTANDKQALLSLPQQVEKLEKRLAKYSEFTQRTQVYFLCLKGVACLPRGQ